MTPPRRRWRWLAAVVALAYARAGAQAVDAAPTPREPTPKTVPSLDSVAQEPLFDDAPGRKALAQRGITLSGHFIAEAAANARGYRGSGADYAQQVDIGAAFDLAKLGLADAGTVRLVLSDRAGHGLHEDRTGGFVQYQAFYGQGRQARFDELSYEGPVFDPRLTVKAGFYAMGNDFAGLPYVCNFNNNGNCGHPLGLLYGSGWVDNPTGQWGSRLKWVDRTGWYAQGGVYDVTPLRKTQGRGFDVGFKGNTGVIVPIEVGYVRGKTASDYAGTYKLGIYWDSSRVAKLGTTTGEEVRGREGAYVQAAQQIWKPEADTVRGIAAFAIATLNDSDTGFFRTGQELGLSWRGPFRARHDDIVSAAWVRLDVNGRVSDLQRLRGLPTQSDEQLFELNYGVQATPSVIVRPSLQYVIRPGGYSSRPDSVIYGIHLGVTL